MVKLDCDAVNGEIEYDIWIQSAKNWDKYKGVGPHPKHKGVHSDWPQWGEEYDSFFGFIGANVQWSNYPITVRVPKSSIIKLKMAASPYFRALLKAY